MARHHDATLDELWNDIRHHLPLIPSSSMRNLHIYLTALSVLLQPALSLRHGSRQLRDMLAFPKYQVEFMNELPLSHSDAERCKAMGVEDEDEFTHVRFEGRDRRAIGHSESEPAASDNAAVGDDRSESHGSSDPTSKVSQVS